MENYHLTEDQQLNQEDGLLTNAMDRLEETKSKLREDNKILLSALKEIAVIYPETNTPEQDKILCKYLIGIAQAAIRKVEPEITGSNIPPIFDDIFNSFFPKQ